MVVPTAEGVTTPVEPIVATVVLLLLHAPLDRDEVNVAVTPVHALVDPVTIGSAFTVTIAVAIAPQGLITL